jgi:hypothetical protein
MFFVDQLKSVVSICDTVGSVATPDHSNARDESKALEGVSLTLYVITI